MTTADKLRAAGFSLFLRRKIGCMLIIKWRDSSGLGDVIPQWEAVQRMQQRAKFDKEKKRS